MVARFDRGLGRVLDLLMHGLTESTLVIVTTDHGVPFSVQTLLDAGVGVMCWFVAAALGCGAAHFSPDFAP